jgi:hypothetical protein
VSDEESSSQEDMAEEGKVKAWQSRAKEAHEAALDIPGELSHGSSEVSTVPTKVVQSGTKVEYPPQYLIGARGCGIVADG